MQGFIFPNETAGSVLWGVIIVLYPFMTCMIDGCAFVASVPFLFKNRKLKPISRLAIIWSLSFVPVAFVPLLLDIGSPQRAFNIMITPRLSSPMAVFGFIFSAVAILVTLEAWLVVRADLVERWRSAPRGTRWIFGILSLGIREATSEQRRVDEWAIKALEIVALPAAIVLTGYVGFIFGTVPANPWWSSPIRPLVFLAASASSGFSMVLLSGTLLRFRQIPLETVRSLSKCLVACLVVTAFLSGLEVISIAYPGGRALHVVKTLLGPGGPLRNTYFFAQMALGVALPVVVLSVALLLRPAERFFKCVAILAGCLGIFHTGVLLWNVVIGGQVVSKSLRGKIFYLPPFGGHKGLLVTLCVAVVPVVIFAIFSLLIPVFKQDHHIATPDTVRSEA